ncbi:hypothetical protein I4641_07000 [Waterburya agarophytonicola K14]|uniref:Uncharacterized protein n=1 Tax=Waterburya agarophytonicola KI4 TaxID=2874699 RepID=A0A964BQM7_9CYAN|nr:hypothetical protein [Waterburya agarophytonicola]MCC0176723.1 hypothetical protein [Waterburya agarophytonicola KI4]
MALKPCKVCGTLNAEGVDTCLSCGYDPQGSKRPAIFRYIAIALVICFVLPFLSGLINWVLLQIKPKSPTPTQPKISLTQKNQITIQCFNVYDLSQKS